MLDVGLDGAALCALALQQHPGCSHAMPCALYYDNWKLKYCASLNLLIDLNPLIVAVIDHAVQSVVYLLVVCSQQRVYDASVEMLLLYIGCSTVFRKDRSDAPSCAA